MNAIKKEQDDCNTNIPDKSPLYVLESKYIDDASLDFKIEEEDYEDLSDENSDEDEDDDNDNVCMDQFLASELRVDDDVSITPSQNTDKELNINDKEYSVYEEHSTFGKTLDESHSGADNKMFQCRFCDLSFTNYSNLRIHSKTHVEVTCKLCNKSVKKYKLKNHLLTHSAKKFSCTICNKSYRRKDYLKVHIKMHKKAIMANSNIKFYDCSKCDMSFDLQNDLDEHMLTHVPKKSKRSDPNQEKIFKCKHCDLSFTIYNTYRAHSKTHVYIACEICKKYVKKYKMKNHLATHSSLTKFSCHICDKSFTRKDNLHAHLKSHNSNADFKCEICEKSFTLQHNFDTHLKRHNDIKEFDCNIYVTKHLY